MRSPNFQPRPAGTLVDMLVLHYTGMRSAAAALERLCDPAAEVSAHYLIDEAGTVFPLVEEEHRAWHAGVSSWRGSADVNSRSIGIELVNPGHEFGYRPFPAAQMAALAALAEGIVSRWPIPARNVVGHSDVAPRRKRDPGELFDWPGLARRGIGLWPHSGIGSSPHSGIGSSPHSGIGSSPHSGIGSSPHSGIGLWPHSGRAMTGDATALLAEFGYDITDPKAALAAFQRHFRPIRCDGVADAETLALLDGLVTLL